MDAIEMLKKQHREVEDLFSEIEGSDNHKKKDLLVKLARKLTGHMEIEEQIFYPAAYEIDSEEIKHAFEEHEEARPVMDKLLKMSGDDEEFNELVSDLEEKIAHHVEDEENDLFPQCRQAMEADELKKLAEEMEELLQKVEKIGRMKVDQHKTRKKSEYKNEALV